MTSRIARFACAVAIVAACGGIGTRGQSHFVSGDRPLIAAQRGLTEIPDPDVRAELAAFQPAAGFEVSLFAAEPLLANPVAFGIDERGRVYVCESFRQDQGVTDNRSHDERWLDADLAVPVDLEETYRASCEVLRIPGH